MENICNDDDQPCTITPNVTPPEVKRTTGGLAPGARQWGLAYEAMRSEELKWANRRGKLQVDTNPQLPSPWWQPYEHSLTSNLRRLNSSAPETTSSPSTSSDGSLPFKKRYVYGLQPTSADRQCAASCDATRSEEPEWPNYRRKKQVDRYPQLPIPWWYQYEDSLASSLQRLNVGTAELTSSPSTSSDGRYYEGSTTIKKGCIYCLQSPPTDRQSAASVNPEPSLLSTADCVMSPASATTSETASAGVWTNLKRTYKRRPTNRSKNGEITLTLLCATSNAVDGRGVPSHEQRRSRIPPAIVVTPATDDDAEGDGTSGETAIPDSRTEGRTRDRGTAGPLCNPFPPTTATRKGPRQSRRKSRSSSADGLLLRQTPPSRSVPTGYTENSDAVDSAPEDNAPPAIKRRKTSLLPPAIKRRKTNLPAPAIKRQKTNLPSPSLVALQVMRTRPNLSISVTTPLQCFNVDGSATPVVSDDVSDLSSQQLVVVDVMNTGATAADSGSDVPTTVLLPMLEVGGGGPTRAPASSQSTQPPSPLEADQQQQCAASERNCRIATDCSSPSIANGKP